MQPDLTVRPALFDEIATIVQIPFSAGEFFRELNTALVAGGPSRHRWSGPVDPEIVLPEHGVHLRPRTPFTVGG